MFVDGFIAILGKQRVTNDDSGIDKANKTSTLNESFLAENCKQIQLCE